MSLTGIKQYSDSQIRDDTESIDRHVGNTRVIGLISPSFEDIRLYWESEIGPEAFKDHLENMEASEQDFAGYRFENDARVSYDSGRVEYSSSDGDISYLDDLDKLIDSENGELLNLAGELEKEYGWIEF